MRPKRAGRAHILIALVWGASPLQAQAGWSKAETEHFVVYGDTRVAALEVATRMERQHLTLARVYIHPPPARPGVQVVVLALSDRRDLSRYLPLDDDGRPIKNVAGLFLSRGDAPTVVVAVDGAMDVVEHEYVHYATEDPRIPMPAWLGEGLADYFGRAELLAPDRVKLGLPEEHVLDVLRARTWIPWGDLLAASRASDMYGDRDLQPLFYGQSWLLVHQALTNPDPRRAQMLADLARRLQHGEPPTAAVREAYGVTLEQLSEDLESYARAWTLNTVTVTLPDPVPALHPSVGPAPAPEVAAARGRVLALVGRAAEADAVLREAVAAWPDDPMVRESVGLVAFLASDWSKAREAFALAAQGGRSTPLVHVGLGYALAESNDPAWWRDALKEWGLALDKDPHLVDVCLPAVRLALRLVDAQAADAWLQRGLEITPEDPWLRLELARSHLRRGRVDFARSVLERLLASNPDLEARLSAEELLGSLPAP